MKFRSDPVTIKIKPSPFTKGWSVFVKRSYRGYAPTLFQAAVFAERLVRWERARRRHV